LVVIFLTMALITFKTERAAAFAGGDGTVDSPYQINACNQFADIANDTLGYYILTTDIDCSDEVFTTGVVQYFAGHLDGQGHRIFGVTIDAPGSNNVGFFRVTFEPVIKNLSIEADVTGNGWVGILAARMGGSGGSTIIENVSTSGTVNCSQRCGGIAGVAGQQAEFYQSHSTATINGGSYVGGITGQLGEGLMENVYYNGTINATGTYVGGLAGHALGYDHVSYGYAAGSISGGDSVGGLFGYVQGGTMDHLFAVNVMDLSQAIISDPLIAEFADFGPSNVSDLYFDTTLTGQSSSIFGIGIADSSRFMGNSTDPIFNGWDFGSKWLKSQGGYPTSRHALDPSIVCEAAQATNTTASVNCAVQPALGWGVPTYQLAYRAKGTTSFTEFTLADPRQLVATITGLTPGTEYEIRYNVTNDFGTTDWSLIEVTTTGTAPTPATDAASTTSLATAYMDKLINFSSTAIETANDTVVVVAQENPDDSMPTQITEQPPTPTGEKSKSSSIMWWIIAFVVVILGWLTYRLAKSRLEDSSR
jgi:hypothetical protein